MSEALRLAEESGLDLVEVAPQAAPPVCRIMDYGKYKYEQEKRFREAKRRHRQTVLKEMKFRLKIDEHDYQIKLNHLKRFLEKGDKTKVTIIFRGREREHIEMGRKLLERLAKDLMELGSVEEGPTSIGNRFMVMVVAPK